MIIYHDIVVSHGQPLPLLYEANSIDRRARVGGVGFARRKKTRRRHVLSGSIARRPEMALMENHCVDNCVDFHVTNTTDKDKTILVFGKEHDGLITPEIVQEAWQVLHVPSQGKTMFSYPSSTSIGGFYSREDGAVVNIGPYKAAPGTTWTIFTSTQYDSGTMKIESML